ncbi:MAG: SAM-dependent methyltransferase [Chitinophagales bacterium]
MNLLDESYWEERYKSGETSWDLGAVSPPLKNYFDQLRNKKSRILIPGAGNGHEAAYLFEQGFENVFVLDISLAPLRNFKIRCPSFPENHLLHEDFFAHQGQYDLIIEQTFFCALDPSLRSAYSKKIYGLLAAQGTIAGLLFDDTAMKGGPPFGGSKEEYLQYFQPLFRIHVLEKAINSIPPRAGRELFMVLKKENGTL